MNTPRITSYAHIKNSCVSVNGIIVYRENQALLLPQFLMEVYKELALNYPKFHKMDLMCKLGILCTEFALRGSDFLTANDLSKTAIILSNASSSLETDRQHHQSINDKSNYFPSPAVFVYTLPNIIIGETAIKYKITGENTFFVSEKFDACTLVNYIRALFGETTQAAICGWVEVDNGKSEAFIFLTENTENTNKNINFKPLNQSTVTELYNQTIWTH